MASSETDKDAKDDCGKSDISEKSQDSTSRDGSLRPYSRSKHRSHQHRPGLQFKVGARLEARDFVYKWYASRVVEIDEAKGEVLIHFEGWSSRFDEWVDMNSPQLRPLTRTSARKDPPKETFHPEYKIGEQVLARWSDCKMYPGKVMSINNTRGTYDVLFYDGMKKTVTPQSLKKMTPEQLEKAKLIPPLTPTGNKKKRKLSDGNDPSSRPQKITKYSLASSTGKEKQTTRPKLMKQKSDERKTKMNVAAKSKKRKLLLIGGSFQAKRIRLDEEDIKTSRKSFQLGKFKSQSGKIPAKIMKSKSEKKETQGNKFVGKQEKNISKDNKSTLKDTKTAPKDVKSASKDIKGATKETKSVIKVKNTAKDVKTAAKDVKSTAKDIATTKDKIGVKETECSTNEDIKPNIDSIDLKEKTIKDCSTVDDKNDQESSGTIESCENKNQDLVESNPVPTDKETTTKLLTDPPPPPTVEQSGPIPETTNEAKVESEPPPAKPSTSAQPSALMQILTSPAANASPAKPQAVAVRKHKPVAKGGAHTLKNIFIDLDHNQFKCQVEGCGKGFRKESLLDSHKRHYHSCSSRSDPVHLVKRRKRISTSDPDSPAPPKPLSMTLSPLVVSNPCSATTTPVKTKRRQMCVVPKPAASPSLNDSKELEKVMLLMESAESNDRKSDLCHDDSTMDTILTNEDVGDELHRDEIVNCVCGLNEENGFMMQCEICLCWQHGTCFNIHNEESLPNKYFCYVCQNPRGLRESFRYKHDHEWWRDGTMTTFGFLAKKKTNRSQHMHTLHNLVAETHNINSVLHGLRLKVDIAKTSKHTSLKMWSKPWNGAREKRPNPEDGNTSADDSLYDNTDSTMEMESSDVEIMDMKDRVVPPHLPHFDHMYSGRLPPPKVQVTPPPSITVEDVKPHIDLSESKGTTSKPNLGLTTVKEEDISEEDKDDDLNIKEESPSQEYTNSPVPTNIKLTGNSIWTPVVKQKVTVEAISQEEQFRICETNLLDHIMDLQDDLSFRLDILEEQIAGLESDFEHHQPSSSMDSMADLSQVKKSLRISLSDLAKVKRMARFH